MAGWEDRPVRARLVGSKAGDTLQITIPAHITRKLKILDGESFKPVVIDGNIVYKRLTKFT